MTSKVLQYKSPLYGRRTGSIELKATSFFDLIEFFPNSNFEELLEIYGFGDGIPFYLVGIDKDFWSWLEEEIKKEKSFLGDEVDFLMRYEFENVSTYKLILEAIAYGRTKMNEIKDFMKIKRTDISPYLRNLLEVKMIKRIVPITENVKSRMGRYYLSDNFLKFWFRYIYPNLSSIEEGIFDINIIRRDYSTYLGYVFENVAKQFLIKERDKFFCFTDIGRWWYKDKEIDIIAMNKQKREIAFFECKWKDLKEGKARKILGELREKSKFVEWKRKKEYFGLIAKKVEGKNDLRRMGYFVFDSDDLERALGKKSRKD